MIQLSEKRVVRLAWLICAALLAVAVVAWGQNYQWRLSELNGYQLFPLLGLVAFNLMLSHYLTGAIRRLAGVSKEALRNYFKSTSYVVLAAILLHPAILSWNSWRSGNGLPPLSYYNYVADDGKIWILAGLLSLTVFLAFEFRRLWRDKLQRLIEWGSDIAILAILLHALFLGSHLQAGWYRGLWYVYGVVFIASLVFNRRYDATLKKQNL